MVEKQTDKNKRIEENRLAGGNKLVFYPNEKLPVAISAVSIDESVPSEEDKSSRKKQLEKFVPRVHTIRFRVWTAFLIMTVVLIAVMWIVGLVFFPTGYTLLQKSGLQKAGEALRENFVSYELEGRQFKKYVDDFSRDQSCSVFIFSYDSAGKIVANYSSTIGVGLNAAGINESVETWFVGEIKEENKNYTFDSFSTEEIKYDSIVVYGTKTTVAATTYYIYISSTTPSFSLSGFSLTTVLLVLTIVLLTAGFFVAYIVSGYASNPIKKLANEVSARKEGGAGGLEASGFAEIDELKDAFDKAMTEVESNNRFRRDLLANVSHDMRTPLTMIQAYAEMIRDISGGNKEKSAKNAATIIAETVRLNSLINEVMELSKLEAGVVEINRRNFDFTEKVKEVIDRFMGLNEARGFNISADIQKGLFADGDPDNIDRVLYNLIGNAINYTGDNKKVTVVCKKVGDKIETHIIDSGKGIAKEDLPAVWDKYYRLVQDKRRVMGSGLGLSIVKTVLDLHAVEYGVISELGVGSDFYFCLPAVKSGAYALPGISEIK